MKTRVTVFGHSVHKILIVFPVGLLVAATLFDVIYLVGGDPKWAMLTTYTMGAGIIGGLLAAPVGWLDWFSIPRKTKAKTIGLTHGLGNVLMLTLFIWSWFLRWGAPNPIGAGFAHVLSFVGLAILTVTGWLGGALVQRMGVSIHEGANLNADLFKPKRQGVYMDPKKKEKDIGEVQPFSTREEPIVPEKDVEPHAEHDADFRPDQTNRLRDTSIEKKSA